MARSPRALGYRKGCCSRVKELSSNTLVHDKALKSPYQQDPPSRLLLFSIERVDPPRFATQIHVPSSITRYSSIFQKRCYVSSELSRSAPSSEPQNELMILNSHESWIRKRSSRSSWKRCRPTSIQHGGESR